MFVLLARRRVAREAAARRRTKLDRSALKITTAARRVALRASGGKTLAFCGSATTHALLDSAAVVLLNIILNSTSERPRSRSDLELVKLST